MNIVLASASPRRSEILEKLNIPFQKRVSLIDEAKYFNDDPRELVKTLSLEKAKSVIIEANEDKIIIGADTVVVYDNKVLGKPHNDQDALCYLKQLSGKMHFVYTGITMLHPLYNKVYIDYCETMVFMRDYNEHEMNAYIKTKEPIDKAGAYAIQGYGATLVDKIDGDYYNVVGLPISKLIEGFFHLGVDYFNSFHND
ncbi:MAG: septum formation protein Maf [Firmicutes bacterium HGW-Firmicutes-1]|nr:MAG: septum formation protein Maf [Firmicutes bacterium HGW-Firmicutes-1]